MTQHNGALPREEHRPRFTLVPGGFQLWCEDCPDGGYATTTRDAIVWQANHRSGRTDAAGPGYCEKCEQPIRPGQLWQTQPGTGGLVQHLDCPTEDGAL